jgi:hypothetical protein
MTKVSVRYLEFIEEENFRNSRHGLMSGAFMLYAKA